MEKFITAYDEQSKNELLKNGYQLISCNGHVSLFINDPYKTTNLNFNSNKIATTNRMTF